MFFVNIARGQDSNDGSKRRPFATLDRALDLVNELDLHDDSDWLGECIVRVRCGGSCKLLPCLGPQCALQICEQHGNGKGCLYTQYGDPYIVFDIRKCKEAECSVAFCDRHRRLIWNCRPCLNKYRATVLSVGEDFLPYYPLVCRRHGKECRRRVDSDASDGEASDEGVSFSVRCLEGLHLASLSVSELMDRVLSIDPELSKFSFSSQLIQTSTVQGDIVGTNPAGEEKFRILLAGKNKEMLVEDLQDKIQAVLVPDFAVLNVFEGAQKLAAPDVIDIHSLSITTIQVISKEQLIQQLQDALESDMAHVMSKSRLDSESEGVQDTCGFFCCPKCYDGQESGEMDPAEYM